MIRAIGTKRTVDWRQRVSALRSFRVGRGRQLYTDAERKFARANKTRVVKRATPDLRVARSRHW
jgi:hypothetical protein